jgi:hypothetical protein
MTATRGSALYTDLLSVPVRPTSRENEWFPTGQPSLRKRASRALSSLIAFCAGVAGACAWWSYGDATRQMIGNSYPQLGWFAPRHPAAVHKAPDRIAPTASDAPDQRQLDAMLGDDLHAIRLSLDRIVAAQELIARSIDGIATRIVASQEQMTRRTDQTATSIAVRQEQTTRSTDQTAVAITTRDTDQTATSIDEAPSKATIITVERQGNAVSLPPTLPLDMKLTEVKPPQTSSERDKQLPAAECFPSAAAVLQDQPGSSPSWTLRAPGHEGTQCWRAAPRTNGSNDRPSAGDHRRETMPKEAKTDRTTENGLGLSAPFARYAMPPE